MDFLALWAKVDTWVRAHAWWAVGIALLAGLLF